MIVLFGLAVIADHAHLAGDFLVIGGGGTGFAAGAKIFAGVEAESRNLADGAGLAPAVFLLGEIFRAVGLAGIFDDDELVAIRQLQDGIHVGNLAVQMYGNDGGDG